ncbi:MAG: GNAT family N-acetyltransferase [Bacilli bacterium]|nr:GNAT family N-acetyltransferase [Bacilli bacterium]
MNIRNCNLQDVEQIVNLWNEDVASEGYFKPMTVEHFTKVFVNDTDFSFDGVFGAFDEDKLIGYAMGFIRKQTLSNENSPAYLNAFIVKKDYRKQGIGDALVKKIEEFAKSKGKKSIMAASYLPLCYSWYIPNYPGHDHPCAPGIRVNSEEYLFLLHRGYAAVGFEDAFHLPLSDYEISPSIQEILERNKEDGIEIEFYDANKHYGLQEFYDDINAIDFEKCIRANLALEKPNPFLVVSEHGKIKGWTGALWNENSGRGHFDGIIISESVRGRGLGKALFSMLAYRSKQNGAKFMTFYTGLNNHARYIYMGAGFKIVQTYALMKKVFK